jgi:murein DD-endopeptidase MepM/ murein hydrolase activator NlpD
MLRATATLTAVLAIGLSLLGGAAEASLGSSPQLVKPVEGARITQPFGCTTDTSEPYDPDCPTRHFHSGIDLAVAAGTPVHATLAGTCQVIDDATGYGLHVIIDHGQGLSSLYAHLETVAVITGEHVAAGQVIGRVGSTGNSTGPHLHFEVRVDGVPQNPQLYLPLP